MKVCIRKTLFVGVLVLSTVSASVLSANAAVTPGAMFDFSAARNGGDPNRWANLGTLAGADLANTGGVDLTRGDASNPSFYTSNPGDPSAESGTWALIDGHSYTIESFSAEIWARRTGAPFGTEHQMYSMWNSYSAAPADRQRIHIGNIGNTGNFNDGEIDVFLDDPVNARIKVQDFGGSILPLDEFVQIVHTWDDVTQMLSVYQNGVPLVSVNVNDVLPDGGPVDMDGMEPMGELSLFKLQPNESSSRRFNGDISRFRLYDFVLTPAQVQDNFDFGNAFIPEPSSITLVVLGILWMASTSSNRKKE